MRSSLGLIGDLDDVELIRDVEEAFGIRFCDFDLQRCSTVGELFGLIETQMPHGCTGEGCATAMCFYRLRRALQPRIATELRPKTPLRELSGLSVRRLHRIIEDECGLRPPPQYLSILGCTALLLLVALPIGVIAMGVAWWIAAGSAILALLLYRVAPIRWPENVATFGDLARAVSSRSIGRLSDQGARLRSPEAWAAFRDVLSDHSLLPKESIELDTLLFAPKKASL